VVSWYLIEDALDSGPKSIGFPDVAPCDGSFSFPDLGKAPYNGSTPVVVYDAACGIPLGPKAEGRLGVGDDIDRLEVARPADPSDPYVSTACPCTVTHRTLVRLLSWLSTLCAMSLTTSVKCCSCDCGLRRCQGRSSSMGRRAHFLPGSGGQSLQPYRRGICFAIFTATRAGRALHQRRRRSCKYSVPAFYWPCCLSACPRSALIGGRCVIIRRKWKLADRNDFTIPPVGGYVISLSRPSRSPSRHWHRKTPPSRGTTP
jgi:hypothetical protein